MRIDFTEWSRYSAVLTCLLLVALTACRSDDPLESGGVFEPPASEEPGKSEGEVRGFYLLNEGNMGANKASLDFYDYTTETYISNVFSKANPELVGGLGDVGNDIAVYGSKLYVVVNVSNKVEVLDLHSGKRLGKIDVPNCRYITFYEGKAYLSAYLGEVALDPNAPNGMVAEIDTTSLQITRTVEVGRQPEELVGHEGKLYVANSGGYSPPDYETTLSVIDLDSFQETERIEVGMNLHRLKIDEEGDLYVSSRGDYYDNPARLYVVDTEDHKVKKSFDLAVSDMEIHKGIAYAIGVEFNFHTGQNTISYSKIDTRTESLLDDSFITDGTEEGIELPYGVAINPQTDEILLTDAGDYVSPGRLYCFSPDGVLQWTVTTGDIPAHIAFVVE
ncbi:YncE family protein [Sinomicrobium sp.]